MFGLNENCKAIADLVIIENIEQGDNSLCRGGIYIPSMAVEAEKIVKGKVISLGPEAKKEGLNIGDIVLYDKHSIHSELSTGTEKVGETVITRVENVIAIVND
jgi:co-chaperonin GroES (HSP10)